MQPTANTIDTNNLEAALVTKWEELPVHDFNSFGEVVIISFKSLLLYLYSCIMCPQIVGFSYVGERFDNPVTLLDTYYP